MTRIETETKIEVDSSELNRLKIKEIYQNHHFLFRKGYDQDHKVFLISRSFDTYLPNIIITQDECMAVKAITKPRNDLKPFSVNEDQMSQNVFNNLPAYFDFRYKIATLSMFEIKLYQSQQHIENFAMINRFQLQEENTLEFINNLSYLARQVNNNRRSNLILLNSSNPCVKI